MNRKSIHSCLFFLSCLLAVLHPLRAVAQTTPAAPGTEPAASPAPRDGQHDFDFEIGTWKTHLRRLLHPLTGSTAWVEYDGISVVRKVWDGRANLVELTADVPQATSKGSTCVCTIRNRISGA